LIVSIGNQTIALCIDTCCWVMCYFKKNHSHFDRCITILQRRFINFKGKLLKLHGQPTFIHSKFCSSVY